MQNQNKKIQKQAKSRHKAHPSYCFTTTIKFRNPSGFNPNKWKKAVKRPVFRSFLRFINTEQTQYLQTKNSGTIHTGPEFCQYITL